MKMNSYISLPFLAVFLPAALLLYSLFPKKCRPFVLLLTNYVFFWFMSEFLMGYLLLSTASIYGAGLWLERLKERKTRLLAGADGIEKKKQIKKENARQQGAVLALAIVVNVGILAVLKYSWFFLTNVNLLSSALHLNFTADVSRLAAPIGISFYSLQAVSYLCDVYKERIHADKNPIRVALFMSFFPAAMEGPICRYSDTAQALCSGERLHYHNISFGAQRIAFGILKKIVIADRLNIIVTTIFKDHEAYDFDGGIIALGALLYTLELYAEFSGTMDVVIGVGEMFGITLPENFRQPFFSKSISEFWQRWHITLGTWFRDYIFYPVTMGKPMKKLTRKARKKIGRNYGPLPASIIAFFCVWLCNGIWHGAGWQYILFGMYHFVLISLGSLILPLSNSLFKTIGIKRDSFPYKCFAIVRTFLLVCIGEMIFNSRGFHDSLILLKVLVTRFSLRSLTDGSVFTLGLDRYDVIILVVSVIIVFAVGLMKEKGKSPREEIAKKAVWIRWPIYILLIVFTVVFGAYGPGYIPIDPIYAGF